ncbi:MAG TPA: pilus assembly PilX N-terminal domain-containing protein [Thermoanaerobaculia bacterium]|nr:pilus assembly PilX N-terminal domain-containing protein [Thermoanaerobaculia bacterium]
MSNTRFSSPRGRRQRGAALILTVIVIMVLTTIGIAMVTFTTTEERTASTYRDALQTRALAEAGVRVVQEMFRRPTERNLVPLFSGVATAGSAYDYYGTTDTQIDDTLKALGIFRAVRAGRSPALYSGNSNRFFYPPFRDTWSQMFGGTYSPNPANDVFDMKFTCTTPTGYTGTVTNCWLNNKINALLTDIASGTDWNLHPGRITDISFYAPPSAGGNAYGITTVRVTAEKHTNADGSGPLLARETIVALIGDNTPEPAVLGNGAIQFAPNGNGCGDGCEQIHANGNANVGTITGGPAPTVTATGTIAATGGSTQPNSSYVTPPSINPWDDQYKPKDATDLNSFYLVTSRPLPVEWTDNVEGNNPPSISCGFSTCQDYGLEYQIIGGVISTTAQTARTAAMIPHIYKWVNTSPKRWDDTPCTDKSGNTLTCNGLQFTVTPDADTDSGSPGWTDDNASIPFNTKRVPNTEFHITDPLDGATVLVDGKFDKSANGSWNPHMSIIAVGSMRLTSQTEWYPASNTQRVIWISGRDISISANCCAPANQCATNLATNLAQGIYATHEQFKQDSAFTALAGLIIAESLVNHDPLVPNTYAIDIPHNGAHDYVCDLPPWNWTRPTSPTIFSLTAAAN